MKNNLFTKECFYNALINLMRIKNFESIQISEICEVAGYNRSTFYRTYKSKIDVLFEKFTREVVKYKKMIQETNGLTFVEKITEFFNLLKASSDLFITMHNSNMDANMYEMFFGLYPLEEKYAADTYFKTFRTAGVFQVVMTWFTTGMKETSQEMAEILQRVMNDCKADY